MSCHTGLFFLLLSLSCVWLHGLQYTRLLCPPLSPGVCSNSCPLSRIVLCVDIILNSGISFLKFIYFYFSWRIITLQYCDGFCHTSLWVGNRHTCVPSILNPPPTSLCTPSLQVVTEHQLWMPYAGTTSRFWMCFINLEYHGTAKVCGPVSTNAESRKNCRRAMWNVGTPRQTMLRKHLTPGFKTPWKSVHSPWTSREGSPLGGLQGLLRA